MARSPNVVRSIHVRTVVMAARFPRQNFSWETGSRILRLIHGGVMPKPLLIALALAAPVLALADPDLKSMAAQIPARNLVKTYVDLRTPHAFENLRSTNPAHYDKIQKMLVGLEEQPDRVEGDWLQVTFHAQDVDLRRMMVKTSYPPKQVLSFRLDDTRYTMYVDRRDMVGEVIPAH